MNVIVIILFFALFASVMSFVNDGLKKKRSGNAKYQNILSEFNSKIYGMLEPGEIVEGVCGYRPCAAVTNRRFLVDTKAGVRSVAFSEIKSVKGMNASGNKTTNPDQMLVFEIKADKKYVLGNHSEGFAQVVNSLYKYIG